MCLYFSGLSDDIPIPHGTLRPSYPQGVVENHVEKMCVTSISPVRLVDNLWKTNPATCSLHKRAGQSAVTDVTAKMWIVENSLPPNVQVSRGSRKLGIFSQ